MSKEEKRFLARESAKPKLITKITDDVEIWVDSRQYIKKVNGKTAGYYTSLLTLIYGLNQDELKLTLKQKFDLEDISKAITDMNKYVDMATQKLQKNVDKLAI